MFVKNAINNMEGDFMGIEYEVRLLDIDICKMVEKLKSLGATLNGVYFQRRYVYDVVPPQKGRWIRLRTNGTKTTLTLKEIISREIDGTSEVEISVSDFDDTNKLLNKLGFNPRSYQENFRIEYLLDGVMFDIDKWPKIPPHIEVEGKTKDDTFKALNLLDITEDDVTSLGIDAIYSEIHGINLDDISSLVFSCEEVDSLKNVLQTYFPSFVKCI